MKLNLLFTFVCFCIFNSYNQSNNSILVGLSSKGEIPLCISENYIPNYNWKTTLNKKVFQTNSHNDYKFAKQSLMSSGFVLFGTKENKILDSYYSAILNQLFPNEKIQLFIYKSNYPTLFCVDGNTIFITTSLLANLNHEDQLPFLLAREILNSKNPNVNITTRNFTCSNLTDLMNFYSFQDSVQTAKIDKLAFELCKSNAINTSQIASSFKLLIDSQLPFCNTKITADQLSNEFISIPSELFEIKYSSESQLRKKTINLLQHEASIISRIKQLGIDLESSSNQTSSNPEIIQLIETMKIEKIRFNIISTNYTLALYELYGLKNENSELDHLHALTWLGIIDKEFGNINKDGVNYFFGDLHQSAGFINFYTLQNANARTAIALRFLKDLKTKHKSDEFDYYFNAAISTLSKSKYFKPAIYSDKKISELEKVTSNDQLKRDNSDFYIYAISDIVKDSTFYKIDTTTLKSTNTKADIDVTILKKRIYSAKKSTKINSKIKNKVIAFDLNISEYNAQEQYGLLSFQANQQNAYSTDFIPVNYFYFKSDGTNPTLISKFDGYYRPTAKKSYFFAITVIGIPYVVSDLFIGAQSSWNTYFFIDPAKGFVTKCSQDFNRDYLTKSNVMRRVNHSILNYEN